MNSYAVWSLVWKIITNTQGDYLTPVQDKILTELSKRYEEDKTYKNSEDLKDFIKEERLEKLDKQLESAVILTSGFYFFCPLILLSIVFWKNISFSNLMSLAFVYTIIIVLISLGIAYVCNLIYCSKANSIIISFYTFRDLLIEEFSQKARRLEDEKRITRNEHERELLDKYLNK